MWRMSIGGFDPEEFADWKDATGMAKYMVAQEEEDDDD
jgi:hypothetical protein